MVKKMTDKAFTIRVASIIREQMLEYILWKISQYKSFDDFRENVKKELCSLHDKNMKHIYKDINGKN